MFGFWDRLLAKLAFWGRSIAEQREAEAVQCHVAAALRMALAMWGPPWSTRSELYTRDGERILYWTSWGPCAAWACRHLVLVEDLKDRNVATGYDMIVAHPMVMIKGTLEV